MIDLIERVRRRLTDGAYPNEAAVSHGVVTPIINSLGWDSSDPDQLAPEFSSGKGRVDFALLGLGRRPSVFIEVKGVGRAVDGDRQLFEYAFHEGVPICVLTDGREWSFYLPSGQGSYEDRRVYRLQLDDRDLLECERVLRRYLDRDRVRNGSAFEDAQRDHRDASGRREAARILPEAWKNLVDEPEELLLELVGDKAESLCGFRPLPSDITAFLSCVGGDHDSSKNLEIQKSKTSKRADDALPVNAILPKLSNKNSLIKPPFISQGRNIKFRVLDKQYSAPNGNQALVQALGIIVSRDAARVLELSRAVGGRKRKHIARSPEEIYPNRPDLARAAEFLPGWLVGLNISNREKMNIIRIACDIYDLKIPEDIEIDFPNAS